ncbi:anti-sigma factor RsbA family regulatory protein [Nocardia sp. NPDC088792]|uniref:anti-sigma factor RsbA family regulatory protein n=1 Tax=Nocardia sp. NPDC088792 TaxID=3364332 RepID=UPI00382438A3
MTTRPPFLHPALLYRDSQEYLAGTLGFIRSGLENDEPVAVSVPTANLALLRNALGSEGDAVQWMDMTIEGRNPGRIIPGVLRAFADAHPAGRVRIIGEPIWADRSDVEYPACVQHEALINAAFAGREVTILCPYDTATLPARILADAYATHPVVIDGDGEKSSSAYDPDRIVASYNRPAPEPPAEAAVFDFDAVTLSPIRHLAVDYARQAGVTGERLIDFELVIAETTTNSVVHGGGKGRLTVWLDGAQVGCRIRDSGHITDPLAGRLPAHARMVGGRGLLIVNQLADLVRIYTGPRGTVLHILLPRA